MSVGDEHGWEYFEYAVGGGGEQLADGGGGERRVEDAFDQKGQDESGQYLSTAQKQNPPNRIQPATQNVALSGLPHSHDFQARSTPNSSSPDHSYRDARHPQSVSRLLSQLRRPSAHSGCTLPSPLIPLQPLIKYLYPQSFTFRTLTIYRHSIQSTYFICLTIYIYIYILFNLIFYYSYLYSIYYHP